MLPFPILHRHYYGQQEESAPFSPLDLTPAFWLKADATAYTDAGTTLATDGQAVQRWSDLVSGNSIYFEQATLASRPTYQTNVKNGLPGLYFDGTDDELLGNSIDLSAYFPSAATLFIVATIDTDDGYVIYNTQTNSSLWRFATNGDGYQGTFRNTRLENYPTSMPTTGSYIFSIVSGASTYQFYTNTTGAGAQSANFLGGVNHRIAKLGTSYFKGWIYEIIAYPDALDADALQQNWDYLNGRWAIY